MGKGTWRRLGSKDVGTIDVTTNANIRKEGGTQEPTTAMSRVTRALRVAWNAKDAWRGFSEGGGAEKGAVRVANMPRRARAEDLLRVLPDTTTKETDVVREYDRQLRPAAWFVLTNDEEEKQKVTNADESFVGTRKVRMKAMADLPANVKETLQELERDGPVKNCVLVTNVPQEATAEDLEMLFHGFHLQGDVILFQDDWKKEVQAVARVQRNAHLERGSSRRALVRLESEREVYRALLERHNQFVCNRCVQLQPLR